MIRCSGSIFGGGNSSSHSKGCKTNHLHWQLSLNPSLEESLVPSPARKYHNLWKQTVCCFTCAATFPDLATRHGQWMTSDHKQAASVRQRLETTRYHLDSSHLTRPFNRDWFIYLLGFIGREDISVRLDNKPWGRCRGLLCVCVVSSLEDLNVCEGLFAWTWKASFRCSFQGHTQSRLCKCTPKQPYKWELEKHICNTILVRNFCTIFKFNQILNLIVILALKSVNTLNQA